MHRNVHKDSREFIFYGRFLRSPAYIYLMGRIYYQTFFFSLTESFALLETEFLLDVKKIKSLHLTVN